MALDFKETEKLEILKQKHKKELIQWQHNEMVSEHKLKMERLNKMLEIAKAGGKVLE